VSPALSAAKAALANGGVVVIHCSAGIHRTGMFGYALLRHAGPAYEATFHGKSVLRLGRRAATCVDCHGLHGVRANADPEAPTNPRHAAGICRKCHPGNTKDFAFSYASHFRLGVERSVVTPLENMLRKTITGSIFAAILGLFMLGIGRVTVARTPAGGLRLRQVADGICLLGILSAVTVAFAAGCMALMKEPDWPRMLHTATGLLIVALFGLLLNRLLFRNTKSN
jgi:hypothetical protein